MTADAPALERASVVSTAEQFRCQQAFTTTIRQVDPLECAVYVACRDASTTIASVVSNTASARGWLMRRPPPPLRGARVALVCPAGPLRGEDDLDRAEANARSFEWEPVRAAHVLDRTGYLAGDDRARLADLNLALGDDAIDVVWCARGGYGVMRLLEHVDYASLRRRPKAVIGYSDITALHAAVATRCEVVTYHGPTARATLTSFSRSSLDRALAGEDSCGQVETATTLHGGRGRGHLVGGNLALLCALAGTPFEPAYDGAILVIEDVNEAVYRIDRMLTQLWLAGRLQRVAAIAFGAFSDIPIDAPEESLGARSLADVLGETAHRLGVPCLAGVPVGHIADQWTLPLGAQAELDADARTLRILR